MPEAENLNITTGFWILYGEHREALTLALSDQNCNSLLNLPYSMDSKRSVVRLDYCNKSETESCLWQKNVEIALWNF